MCVSVHEYECYVHECASIQVQICVSVSANKLMDLKVCACTCVRVYTCVSVCVCVCAHVAAVYSDITFLLFTVRLKI